MSPASWNTQTLIVTGALWALLGFFGCIGLAMLLRRWMGTERSLGLGLSVWSAGNLLTAGLMALHLYAQPQPARTVDGDGPVALMGVCGAFGGVGALFGGLMLAQGGGQLRAGSPPAPRALATWRRGLGNLLGQLGLLLFVGAFAVPWLLDGSTERAVQFGMRCVASAMGCWLLSAGVAGTLNVGAAVFLLTFGGALLGFAELMRLGF